MDTQDAQEMFEVNFLSVVALTKEVVKGMMTRNKGHIVNMSSIAGKEAYQGGWACNPCFMQLHCSQPSGNCVASSLLHVSETQQVTLCTCIPAVCVVLEQEAACTVAQSLLW